LSTAGELLRRDAPRLIQALSLDANTARLEVRILLGHTLTVGRSWLIAHEHEHVPPQAIARYEALLSRRLAGEPIAYILGQKEFYGRMLRVTPEVLIPRPETELLVELALTRCRAMSSPQILDLGTGSGCIAITLALECLSAQVTAVEASSAAMEVARHNAVANQVNVEIIQSHWFEALGDRQFDIIVANPPYVAPGDSHLQQGDVRHEPVSALVADDAGLADIQEIVVQAKLHLRRGGELLMEHGYNQAVAVRALLKKAGYAKPESWFDMAGIERVTGAEMSE
jgi:release factor glutamine methyltransferase